MPGALLFPGARRAFSGVFSKLGWLHTRRKRLFDLARSPDAVILDEPFTGLDTAARDACAEVVLDLLDGRMLLLATHDVADAQALNISDIITL